MPLIEELEAEIEEAVQKAVLLSLLTMPEGAFIREPVYCSYKTFHKFYVEAKLAYFSYERLLTNAPEFIGFQDTTWSKRQFLANEYRRLERLVYRSPCKYCDVCLTRRKSWP